MRIGINGYLAARGAGGLARHTLVLLDGLTRLDTEHRFVVFSDRPLPARFAQDPRIESRVFPLPRWTTWEQVGLPLALRRAQVDLFFGPYMGLPLLSSVPAVVMVHDLAWRRFPETYPRKKRGYYQLFVGASVRKARRVLCPSYSTGAEVHELLGVPRERIDVVHNAVAPRFRPLSDSAALAAVRERYQLPSRYLLYLGTIEPRKNLERLLRAYALARQAHGVDVPLVLAGPLGWLYDQILALPAELGIAEHVIRPGFIDDADLPGLYAAAELFVYPSLYEGFGLPVVEAMACGTPVVTTSTSSLPEVAGEAAIVVDPLDMLALAQAIADGLRDEARRARLRTAGLAQAARFSQEQQARGTLACFERALAMEAPAVVAR